VKRCSRAKVPAPRAQSYNSLMQRFSISLLLVFCSAGLRAEVHEMTLRQAVDRALEQNPDIALARLDEQKAAQAVRLAKAPFSPTIGVGSGLAYSSGFPMSIDGAAPSIVQARASGFIFNRRQSYLVAEAREGARGAGIATSAKREEVAFRTASLFLDIERAAQLTELAHKQVESLAKIEQAVADRMKEGRALPVDSKRAALNVARGKQRVEQLASDQDAAERSLAVVLGLSADDQVRAKDEQRQAPSVPESETTAIDGAIQSSKELRRLESALIAKGLDVRAQKATRLPTVDLIAQYGLFAKFNNYENFFRTFERNNGEIGVSFQLPILPGPGVSAAVAQAEVETARLRVEMNAARNRISLETRQSYQALRRAETARDVARLDLEVSRDQVSILLAQMNEGRASLAQLEEARFLEDEKWIAFYDAQYTAEKAAWDLLRQTGNLLASLK
jgi:outer membrane protein